MQTGSANRSLTTVCGGPQALQEADDGMTEEEWAGALHWKTWVLAGLDICISTIKYGA